jgi:hypothetical protein
VGRVEEKALMALLKTGESLNAIAAKLGKTSDSIEHTIRRLGLKEGAVFSVAPSSSTTFAIALDAFDMGSSVFHIRKRNFLSCSLC